jgi:pimeloyl-ACP methyl ester carboxylesterase
VDTARNPIDGTSIAYTTTGDGPPVLLVHGSLLSHQIWRTFGYVRALRDRYRLILVDQRGHGRSGLPTDPESYSMDLITADLTAVLDAVGVDTTHYLGYSFGGRTGLHLAARAPERLRSLIIGGAGSAAQKGALDALFFPGCADVIAERGMDAFVDTWSAGRAFPVDSGTRAAIVRNDARAMAAYFRASDADPGLADDVVSAITLPTAFVVGSQDVDRIDDARRTSSLISGAELHVVPGYDHATTVAAPETQEIVRAFLGRRS